MLAGLVNKAQVSGIQRKSNTPPLTGFRDALLKCQRLLANRQIHQGDHHLVAGVHLQCLSSRQFLATPSVRQKLAWWICPGGQGLLDWFGVALGDDYGQRIVRRVRWKP
jgi:hypothetical protein